ncbi:MAG: hypothetical protein CMH62_02785 [Nanoarchaeota archaeon]|nr:hypothetical protein [Nanoarchaeota archaeon]|tara:strand:- start:292 stop:864 length:573 start_codon:yes stop_codon:yes gene_type:complete
MKVNSKVLVALFLAAIMISSVLGFILSSSHTGGPQPSRVKFGDFFFVETSQGWVTHINGDQQVIISSDPRNLNLAAIPDISLNELNSAGRVYFTLNPNDNIQNSFAYFNANIIPRLRTVTSACSEDVHQCENLPLITCDNALPSVKVIQTQISNSSSVTYNNDCLLIQGNSFQIRTLYDAVILKLLTISS